MDYTHILGWAAVCFSMLCYSSYIFSILRGQTKPHLFSYIIWASIGGLASLMAFVSGAGAGAWAMTSSAIIAAITACLAVKYGSKDFKRTDIIALVVASLIMPLWLITDNPIYAMALIILIDWAALYPTLRKTWHTPFEEDLPAWLFCWLKNICAILAMEHTSWITVGYPLSSLTGVSVFITICLIRRLELTRSTMAPVILKK